MVNSKTVDYGAVMSWNPCEDFSAERIKNLFADKEEVTISDVFDVDMRQDEQLWIALREVFFFYTVLEVMAIRFCMHVAPLADHEDKTVTEAVLNTIMAAGGNFNMLPPDDRHDRWERGATYSEKCAALSALWAATARANTKDDKDERLIEWNLERDWQVEHVKKKAGINAD